MFIRSRLRLWWARLYVRKDEFHYSLDLDHEALMTMKEEERQKYQEDLIRRRNVAHEMGLK